MLLKKFRLQRREIEDLKSSHKEIAQGKYFGLIYQKNLGERKFALIISNKISKKATIRNKIKRLFYKALTKELPDFEGKFLFLAKKNCLMAKLEDFEKEIEEFRNKLF